MLLSGPALWNCKRLWLQNWGVGDTFVLLFLSPFFRLTVWTSSWALVFFVVFFFSLFKAKSYHYSSLQAQEPHSKSLMEAYQEESELEMRLPQRWGGGWVGWVVAFFKKPKNNNNNNKWTMTHICGHVLTNMLHVNTIELHVFYLHLSCRLCNHIDTRSRMCSCSSGAQTGNRHTAVTNHPSGASSSSILADKAVMPVNIG